MKPWCVISLTCLVCCQIVSTSSLVQELFASRFIFLSLINADLDSLVYHHCGFKGSLHIHHVTAEGTCGERKRGNTGLPTAAKKISTGGVCGVPNNSVCFSVRPSKLNETRLSPLICVHPPIKMSSVSFVKCKKKELKMHKTLCLIKNSQLCRISVHTNDAE